MPEIPRTKFNSPWTVAVIEAALNDVSSAKGSSESLTAALNAMRAEINSLSGGVHLKGAVDYYSDLPASPSEGDAYTVRYQGTSGTDPLGIEYAWATYQGMPQWIPIGVDPSVFAKQAEMNVVANAGAKNIFDIQAEAAIQRTTTVLNSDGGITISCNTASWATRNAIAEIPAGDYICSLFVDAVTIGGGTFAFFVNQSNDKSTWTELARQASITSTGRIDMPISVSQKYLRIATNINNSNTSATNSATIRLMLHPASITDHTFQPFARTNRELTVLTDEDRASLVELVDSGAKNVADMSKSTFTTSAKDGVTVTMSGDTITSTGTSGTATNQFHRILYDAGKLLIPAGTWIAALIGTGTDAFRIEVNSSSYSDLVKGTYGNPVQFTIPEGDTESYARITQKPSTNCAGTFKLMITTPAAWKISQTFQQYRPSWQEMYDMILALQSGGDRALTMQTEPEEQEER